MNEQGEVPSHWCRESSILVITTNPTRRRQRAVRGQGTWVQQAAYLDTSSYYRELQYVTLRILSQFTKSVKASASNLRCDHQRRDRVWRDNYSGTKDLLFPQDVDPDVRHLLAQAYLENS